MHVAVQARAEMKLTIQIMGISRERHFVTCSSLPGCSAHGTSPEEALKCMDIAVRAYLASMDVLAPERLEFDVCSAASELRCSHQGRLVESVR